MKLYRAIISAPVTADSDDDAIHQAMVLANKVERDGCVLGHVEIVSDDGGFVYEAPDGAHLYAGRRL